MPRPFCSLTVDLSPCFPRGEGSAAAPLSLLAALSLPTPTRPSSGGSVGVGGSVPKDGRALDAGDDTRPLKTAAGNVSQIFPAPAQDNSES